MPNAKGALIDEVTKDSPAEKAGMKRGDVIVTINDKPIQDSVAAMAAIAALKPGVDSKFGVLREQKNVGLTVNVGKRQRNLPVQPLKR